jgi:hypothetical protein
LPTKNRPGGRFFIARIPCANKIDEIDGRKKTGLQAGFFLK